MKRIKNLYIWCVSIALSLASCTDEYWSEGNSIQVKEGIPVSVSISYRVADAIESRTAQTEDTEKKVNRICAIAFRSDGTLSGRSFDEAPQSNVIELNMLSGSNQRIFLVANYNSGVGSLDRSKLEDENLTLEKFMGLSSTLTERNKLMVDRLSFLMSGQLMNNSNPEGESITVSEDPQIGIVNGGGPIVLKRVDARISFNIFAKNDEYLNFTFQPKYYRVEQIPQSTYVIPQENDCAGSYESMSVNNEQKNFDGEREVIVNGKSEQAHYFEFYVLENRKSGNRITKSELGKQTDEYDNTGITTLYALREKRKKISVSNPLPGQAYSLGDWVYANPNSTYVTIRGTLSYETKEKQFVNADVTYTVHLGNTGNSTNNEWYNDETLVNNYETCRNTHYTYNVTITGIESIKVEVQNDQEQRPGMEGDVIVAGGQVEDMDAHYGRSKFTLSRKAIKDGLSWAFSTPFQRGMKVFDKESADLQDEEKLRTTDLNDYKWIKFAINKEYSLMGYVYPTEDMVKFPGEDAYDGGEGSITGGGTPAPAYGISDDKAPTSAYYGNTKVKLYDVNQLLNHLYEEANDSQSNIFEGNGDDATVTITAFVDEFVYKYNPTEVYYEGPDAVAENDPDLLLWKRTVNGDNRMLHICLAGAEYSPDGNSSWAQSVISFSQRPVYTFYNPNNEELKTAWGVESKGETGELPVDDSFLGSSHPNSTDNGRENTLNIIPQNYSLRWSDAVSVHDAGGLLGRYYNVWYACLLRNRDLDGDNIVDPEEIRWYLASIDQLTDIWIGEAAIPIAKLYTKEAEVTDGTVPLEHIVSSSYRNGDSGTPWIIWAEEGASRGGYNISGDEDYGRTTRSYRCVRNLGLSLNHITDVPQDYVIKGNSSHTANGQTYTERTIDVSRLNSNTLRPTSEDNLLPYPLTERDASNNNRPPRKFAVIESATNNTTGLYPNNGVISWLSVYQNETNGNPCPRGYRMPNQRELMLMYTTYPDLFQAFKINNNDLQEAQYSNYLCKTGFSFNGKGGYSANNRYGFLYVYEGSANYGNLKLSQGNESGKVRCVRDMQ